MPRTPTSPVLAAAQLSADGVPPLTAKRKGKRAAAEEPQAAAEAAETEAAPPVKRKAKRAAAEEASKPAEEPQAAAETAATEAPRPKKARKAAKAEAQEPQAPAAAAEAPAEVPAAGAEASDGPLDAEAFRAKFHITSAKEGQQLPDPVQSFEEAPFGKKVQKALRAAGFTAPSPIQAQGWPAAVTGKDLVAVAKTGSGKTLAFLLPAFKLIAETEAAGGASGGSSAAKPPVLVLAPTRELATQIEAECSKFAKFAKVRSLAVFGGVPKGPQAQAMRENPQVLVATPGRLQDLMEMKAVSLKAVQLLVLDEADRMLDMGFEPEIAKILTETPKERQTLLFTATWPKAVKKIAANYLKEDFLHVNVGQTEELAANRSVTQEFHKRNDEEKEETLWRILDSLPDSAKLICFANTKRRIDSLAKAFSSRGYDLAAVHGDKAQRERDRELAEFASGKCWLLFATDVCARGLDIKEVTHVVNYDMARDVESYVHRIGRTGRAGNSGTSITFWNEDYDMECAPALVKIAKEAGQEVPDWLEKAAAKQKQVKNKGWRY
mmetsp:Transcript_63346/g.196560  ORF Transcript_63346/g.196560 Transcript_63346/m.196560 type:complete len:551 (-) Transcript_63346:106-1758(-)